MTVQDVQSDPDSQLPAGALPAIVRLEAPLACEREASQQALHSADLLDALADLNHGIAEQREQLSAVDLIAPDAWAAEGLHYRAISWLLDPSAHHRQDGHLISTAWQRSKEKDKTSLGGVVKRVYSRSLLPGVGRRPGMTLFSWHSGSLSRATA